MSADDASEAALAAFGDFGLGQSPFFSLLEFSKLESALLPFGSVLRATPAAERPLALISAIAAEAIMGPGKDFAFVPVHLLPTATTRRPCLQICTVSTV